ncbi:universal stress protein [Amycolatopsis sp. K13G38]|uniref:Universal stress protein n=1 Tax=Amycolatopsis acididurans TaxID=2724524 RepID=A0ABX1J083_9PSEU|nr:universal stress protein [Amycolatopsis acididurans]
MVVGVDGSDSASHAARWAAAEAAGRGRELVLVHAVEEVSLSLRIERLRDAARLRGKRVLQAAQESVREVAPGLTPRLLLSEQGAPAALLEHAGSASLIVTGARGLGPQGRFMTGSVPFAVATHASCPVAVIRGHTGEAAPPAEGPVVLGVDAGPSSEEAIAIAFEEAAWRGAPLLAVRCWNDTFLVAVYEEMRWTLDRSALEAAEREMLAQSLAGWEQKYPNVAVEQRVVRGRPAEELVAAGDGARMLVVGSRGLGGVAGMFLGSTSQRVVSAAHCPVLVARHRAG